MLLPPTGVVGDMQRSRRIVTFIVATAAAWFVGGCIVSTMPGSAPAPTAVGLWGDSIAVEIAPTLQGALTAHNIDFEAHVHGGTAPCEWLDDFGRSVTPGRYSDVVILFVGNPWGECTHVDGRMATGDELVEIYRRDVSQMIAIADQTATRVHVVLPPAMDPEMNLAFDVIAARLTTEVYRPIAAANPGFVDLIETAQALGTTFRVSDSCRPDEAAFCDSNGRLALRTGDGVRLCPVQPAAFYAAPEECAVASPGARRLGRLAAQQILGTNRTLD